MKTNLRALAALLSYPDEALVAALPELAGFAPRPAMPLVRELRAEDLYRLEERYVALFDRSRALSLHLFEHVHGESRERGQAMADLQAMYAARGLRTVEHELPDYLPAFLEFVSLLPSPEARGHLRDAAAILRSIGDRLAERGSAYAGVFAALLELAGEAGLTKPVAPAKAAAEDRAALDAQWMDPEVTFGPRSDIAPVRFYRRAVDAGQAAEGACA